MALGGTEPARYQEKSDTMILRTLAGVVPLAVMSVAAGLLPAAAKTNSSPDASRAEVQRLVSQFRGASKDPQKRAQLVQQAIQAGPAAAGGIMRAISRELAPDVKRYTARFSQKAAPLAQKRLAGVKGAEVNALRQTVLGLKDAPNFTHETITAKADPAMKRLREIFLVGRQEVLERTPALQTDRQKLLDAARLWDQCAACVYQHMAAGAEAPGGADVRPVSLRRGGIGGHARRAHGRRYPQHPGHQRRQGGPVGA